MRQLIASCSIVVLAVLFAAPALAKERIIMKDGSVRKGEILEVTESGRAIEEFRRRGFRVAWGVPTPRESARAGK